MIFHFAVSFRSDPGITDGREGSHPAKEYPSLTGFSGTGSGVPASRMMLFTGVPPFESKVTEDMRGASLIQTALTVMFSAGMDEGTEGSHPENAYPSRTGFSGRITAVPYSRVMLSTGDPPSESKVMVNFRGIQTALTVMFSAGMAGGSDGAQPENAYPSRTGFSGRVTAVPYSCVMLSTGDPPSESKVMV